MKDQFIAQIRALLDQAKDTLTTDELEELIDEIVSDLDQICDEQIGEFGE